MRSILLIYLLSLILNKKLLLIFLYSSSLSIFFFFFKVESYSSANDQWTLCPSLTEKKGSLAGATLDGKIFAMGGGNGFTCFSDVEMLDLDVGRWIRTRSMTQKVNVLFG